VDRDAPQEAKDFLGQYYIRDCRPAGLTDQDDMGNWNYAHSARLGTIARRHPYNYGQGLGFEQPDFEYDGLRFPGVVTDLTEATSSEDNLRDFYKRWAEFMGAPSWNDLAGWRDGSDAK